MGVDIDPAGSDQETARVDLAPCRAGLAADLRDQGPVDCQVAAKGRGADAVEDRAAANGDVMHNLLPPVMLAA